MPSIFMPRWASRITLRLTDVRVERVQDINDADAQAEGAQRFGDIPLDRIHERLGRSDRWSMETPEHTGQCLSRPRWAFANFWNKLHGPDAWDRNDWVWCLSFEVIHANVDEVLADAA